MGVDSKMRNITVKMVTVEFFISTKHYFRPVPSILFYNALGLMYVYPKKPKSFQSRLEQ